MTTRHGPPHPTTRARRVWRAVRSAAVTLVAANAMLAANPAPAQASWYDARIGNTDVSLRDCYHPSKAAQPSQSCTYLRTVPAGTPVNIVCQHAGQDILDDQVWDYIVYPDGQGYVSDYYVNTGHDDWIPGVDVCLY